MIPRLTTRTNLVRFIPLFILMLAGTACRKDEAKVPGAPRAVHVVKATRETSARQIAYPGTIEGVKRVSLSTKIMGQIISLPFREGSAVRAGQVIGRIKNDDLIAKRSQISANRDEAQAALTNISANYERIHDLFGRKSATQKELDDVSMALDMAKAKLKAIDGMDSELGDVIRYATIISPFDGTIVGRYAEEGNMANPGMPILAVEDTRTLRIALSVPESEIQWFHLQDDVSVRIDAIGTGITTRGVIDEIGSAGNGGTHQFQVKVAMQNPSAFVRSGMYATVFASASGSSTISLPDSLIIHRGELDGIYVVTQDNQSLLRWVRTGKTYPGGRVEVLTGLSEGETVVSSDLDQVVDGMNVKVIQ